MEQKVSYKKQEARLLLRDRERIRGTSHWINESSADLQSTVSLKVETLIRGRSRLLETPFNRSYMTSYMTSYSVR